MYKSGLLLPILVTIFLAPYRVLATDDGEEIKLNVERIASLGDPEVLLTTISRLALALSKCGVDVRGLKELELQMLPETGNAKCMDGSRAGYYIRRKTGSRKWLVFLEGGFYCFDKKSCRMRGANTPNLTSSAHWPQTREGSGILSWNPEENPFLFSANIVFVPYCSSDAWTGNTSKNNLRFMGAAIVDEVIQDLLKIGLADAEKLFLAGSSAGATGVLMNIDKVSETLAEQAPGVNVHGIVDSGWFLDTDQQDGGECNNALNCSPAQSIRKGFRFWKSRIPKRCRRAYSEEPWKCYFGYRHYPYIRTPIFIIAYLYDRAQLIASMGGGVSVYQQVQEDPSAKRSTTTKSYMQRLGTLMNNTLSDVSAVFAPACMDHEILLRSMWHQVSINGRTLLSALRCWEGSQEATNKVRQQQPSAIWGEPYIEPEYSGEEPPTRTRHPGNRTDRNNRRRKNRKRKQRRRRMRNRVRRDNEDEFENSLQATLLTNQLKRYKETQQAQCIYKLHDSCTAVNCNLACPSYFSVFNDNNSGANNDYNMMLNAAANERGNAQDTTALEELIDTQR